MKKCFTNKNKSLKVMKICTLQVVIAIALSSLAVAHNNYGQVLDKKVTLSIKGASLEEVLDKIESAANVKFFYSVDQLNITIAISLETHAEPLHQVLNKLLGPYEIT